MDIDSPRNRNLDGVDVYPWQEVDDPPYDLYQEYTLLRIPSDIRPALEPRLRAHGSYFVVAWLQAICASFPERKLIDLVREGDPRLFPPCLGTKEAEEYATGYLELIDNDVVSVREDWLEENKPPATRLAELEAFRACRFQQGFASEGMLCNQPPIPLRVLDFLETQDLVNLSLVCKSAHQAAHLLFKREEAVAVSRSSSELGANEETANLLWKTRLASLMHGTPEAIPEGSVGDRLIRQSPAEPTSLRSATWRWNYGTEEYLGNDLHTTLEFTMARAAGMFIRQTGWINDEMCVLEEPQLQALQAMLVRLQARHLNVPEAREDDIEMMRGLVSLVDDALEMRESILLWGYGAWLE